LNHEKNPKITDLSQWLKTTDLVRDRFPYFHVI
jgi:hypothetical protein